MTSTVKLRARTLCRRVFTGTLLLFLAMACVLVGTQLVGVVLMQPGLVSWGSDVLLTPCITAAVVFGVVAFVSAYVMPAEAAGGD
ncbi:hypothetical protein [Prauserella rugosa]|uniref:Uncharacterized protein n=1 Tax=Prauserella rugosa TaxID=43354 RepID=A0A660C5V4_9PSEU|nr:hypothetical protein [Prauserella rugosa]KID29855.1 hypothetical protein HQ32_02734 [Prauserella sp. Am3]KMS86447.1 hypothetical protein ACZ91_36725 [Streptomyces regensis]TWH18862.1 hypothetical protein JD82_00683 [Prauserella rugosa]